MSDIYKNIEKYRLLKGMSKKDFFDLIGMTGVGYAAMEKNKSIKLNTLKLISQTLSVSLSDLLEEEIKESKIFALESEEQLTKPTNTQTINPALLEQESINRIINLPINDDEKIVLLIERINLLQLHLKIVLDSSEQQGQQLEKLKRHLDKLI